MSTAAYAGIPQAVETVDAPISNEALAELEKTRVLFFAHDTVTDQEKRELEFKSFGGIFMPEIKGLRDTRGMLYRCQLTLLSKFKMVPNAAGMLGEKALATSEAGFVQNKIENGQVQQRIVKGFPVTVPEQTREGNFATRPSNHVVYHKRYPAHDVRRATQRKPPHGAGGVVEITALAGATPQDVNEAQLFFFPLWREIREGNEELPGTVSALEAHLKSRIEAARIHLGFSEEKRAKFVSIGNDMLQSSREFARHAANTVRSDDTVVQTGITKGAAGEIFHSPISEKYLEQTESVRKGDLLTGERSATKELVGEMREERKEKSDVARQRLNLEERKQYVAEITAGIRERDSEEEVRLGIKASTNQASQTETAPVDSPVIDKAPIVVEEAPLGAAPEVELDGLAEGVSYSIGDKIQLASGTAEVIAKRFGRIKVRLADGTETMLDKLTGD